jgi:hypothetical protein
VIYSCLVDLYIDKAVEELRFLSKEDEMAKITIAEIYLCIDRLLADATDDFFPDPIQYKDLKLVKNKVAFEIKTKLHKAISNISNKYQNHEFCHWDVPKKNYVVRHAICMHPLDRIIYNVILHELAPRIEPRLSKCRYSYPIKSYSKKKIFGENPTENWIKFKTNIRDIFKKNKKYKYLVSTDIAGFFEYIHLQDFRDQIYNISQLPRRSSVVELLYQFQKTFAPSDHSGIPQNYDCSSYLASAFLDFLDKAMETQHYKYYRYVDDIKVACVKKKDGRKIILKLIHSLRRYNLNLATHKTEIWSKEESEYKEFVQDFPLILQYTDKAVKDKRKNSINIALSTLIRDVKKLLKKKNYNDRLFRAYIWRIVKCHWFKDIKNVNKELKAVCLKCINLIEEIPGETDSFIRFILLQKNRKYIQIGLKNVLKESIYDWQEMHIWNLLIQADIIKDQELFDIARSQLNDTSKSTAARNYAIIFLGKHGNYHDRDNILNLLKQPTAYFTKRCIYVAMQEHPNSKMLYNNIISSESDITLRSLAQYLKQLKVPEYVFEDKRIGSDKTFIS